MLHVRKRKVIAAFIAGAALVISVWFYLFARRTYAPSAVKAAVGRELSLASLSTVDLKGGRIRWEGTRLEGAFPCPYGTCTFQEVVFWREDGVSITAEPAEVSFVAGSAEQFRIDALTAPDWYASLDLIDSASDNVRMGKIYGLASRLKGLWEADQQVERDSASEDRRSMHLDLTYAPSQSTRYVARMADFGDGKPVPLLPDGADEEEGWSLTWTPTELTLGAPLGSSEELAASVEAEGADILSVCRHADALFKAVWSADGEKATFTSETGWRFDGEAVEGLGIHVGDSSLEGAVNSFETRDRRLTAVSGSLNLSAERLSARLLEGWLKALGIDRFDGDDLPDYFENVRIAADFRMSEGQLSISPPSEAAALVWSELNGDTIILRKDGVTSAASHVLERLRNVAPPEDAEDVSPSEEVAVPAAETPPEEPAEEPGQRRARSERRSPRDQREE